MIDKAFAEHFAADWVDSWNNHDLDRILAPVVQGHAIHSQQGRDQLEMKVGVLLQRPGPVSAHRCFAFERARLLTGYPYDSR